MVIACGCGLFKTVAEDRVRRAAINDLNRAGHGAVKLAVVKQRTWRIGSYGPGECAHLGLIAGHAITVGVAKTGSSCCLDQKWMTRGIQIEGVLAAANHRKGRIEQAIEAVGREPGIHDGKGLRAAEGTRIHACFSYGRQAQEEQAQAKQPWQACSR